MSIELHLSGDVATILLNRPEKLNALTAEMWQQFIECLDRCKRDPAIRSIILTGSGRGFCAGADLSAAGSKDSPGPSLSRSLTLMEGYNEAIQKLYRLDKPVIAAVRGPAIGIAWTFVLCCDWVLVTDSTLFRPAFLNLAKVPEGGFQYLLARQIGQLKARDIVYRARFVSGSEAVELGLANRLVAEEALLDEANTLAREAANNAPIIFSLTKQLFNSDPTSFEQFLQMELNAIAIGSNSEDALEGMAAFKDKRAPRYVGR
jgi:2-(1,2-epoxy-1,2-dihydrophenyl)acetyl-CoA isomerase